MNLLPGVVGDGPIEEIAGRRYRRRLVRSWVQQDQAARTILWIGMNPSVADANHDDRTCRREQKISCHFGLNRYLKGNILDLIEQNSIDIPLDLSAARTDKNLVEIRQMAGEAECIILAHGHLPSLFLPAIEDVYTALRLSQRPIRVLQWNSDGTPTHTRRILNANIGSALDMTHAL